jgi:hypothetical protein
LHIRVSAQKMGVVEQLGNAQQRKLASQKLADSGLWYIKKFFELPGSEFFPLDELEDVLVKIGFQLEFQTILLAHIKLIKDASLRPVGDQSGVSLLHAAVHGAV